MSEEKRLISVASRNNDYYFVLEPHDINQLMMLPDGCALEVNLGKSIDLLGGNVLELSSDLIITVHIIHDKFVEDESD